MSKNKYKIDDLVQIGEWSAAHNGKIGKVVYVYNPSIIISFDGHNKCYNIEVEDGRVVHAVPEIALRTPETINYNI